MSTTVYNIEVKNEPVYYANGILVHNCMICNDLNGRIFDVKIAYQTVERAAELDNSEELKTLTPWIGYDKSGGMYVPGKDGGKEYLGNATSKELQEKGIGLPPAHGRCRCDFVVDLKEERKSVEVQRPENRSDAVENYLKRFSKEELANKLESVTHPKWYKTAIKSDFKKHVEQKKEFGKRPRGKTRDEKRKWFEDNARRTIRDADIVLLKQGLYKNDDQIHWVFIDSKTGDAAHVADTNKIVHHYSHYKSGRKEFAAKYPKRRYNIILKK